MTRRTSRAGQKGDSKTIRITPKIASKLSNYRKEILAEQVNRGVVKEGINYDNSSLNKILLCQQTIIKI